MIYRAVYTAQNELRHLPETGMGYQVIEAMNKRYNIRERFVAYNSEILIEENSNFLAYKYKLFTEGYGRIQRDNSINTIDLSSIRLISKNEIVEARLFSSAKRTVKNRTSGGTGAKDNAKEYANGAEYFVRLSAYEEDKRIDSINKKLLEGSYTTTFEDYKECVVSNDDPIDRYALPNDESIKFAFYILPKNVDILQRGIVQPAFEHAGGGKEVYFENGTSNNTYIEKRNYGQ